MHSPCPLLNSNSHVTTLKTDLEVTGLYLFLFPMWPYWINLLSLFFTITWLSD